MCSLGSGQLSQWRRYQENHQSFLEFDSDYIYTQAIHFNERYILHTIKTHSWWNKHNQQEKIKRPILFNFSHQFILLIHLFISIQTEAIKNRPICCFYIFKMSFFFPPNASPKLLLLLLLLLLLDRSRPSVEEAAHDDVTRTGPSVFMRLSVCSFVCTSFVGYSFCHRNMKSRM